MSFADGFAEGFANSYAQSYDAAEKRRLFLEETNKKKSAALEKVRPALEEQRIIRENTYTTLDYLEGRGVNAQTMSVLASDPDALEEANKLLTSTEAADWNEEQVNTYLRSVISGKPDDVDWRTQFQQGTDRLMELLSMDLNSVDETEFTRQATAATLPPTRRGTVEFVPPPKKEDLGISAIRGRTEDKQLEVFDKALMDFALKDLERASASGDVKARVELSNLIENYSKDLAARAELTNRYRDSVLILLEPRIEKDPDLFAGFENNLMIFNPLSPEAAEQFEQVQETPVTPTGDTKGLLGTRVKDGVVWYVYRNEDGTLIERRTLR